MVRTSFDRGSQVITCGNGGSAHTASHYITDWSKAITLATGAVLLATGFMATDEAAATV